MSDAATLRASLAATWRKTPQWIGGASVQQVRAYKKAYVDMQKLLAKSSASLGDLQAAYNRTMEIYK